MNQRLLGQQGEHLAEDFLTVEGYKILRRNYRNKLGEIDLIAQEKGCICFVEVKWRQSTRFGGPEEAITFAKKKKLFLMALAFLKKTFGHVDKKCRFDVVAIQEGEIQTPKIILIKNAIVLDGLFF